MNPSSYLLLHFLQICFYKLKVINYCRSFKAQCFAVICQDRKDVLIKGLYYLRWFAYLNRRWLNFYQMLSNLICSFDLFLEAETSICQFQVSGLIYFSISLLQEILHRNIYICSLILKGNVRFKRLHIFFTQKKFLGVCF